MFSLFPSLSSVYTMVPSGRSASAIAIPWSTRPPEFPLRSMITPAACLSSMADSSELNSFAVFSPNVLIRMYPILSFSITEFTLLSRISPRTRETVFSSPSLLYVMETDVPASPKRAEDASSIVPVFFPSIFSIMSPAFIPAAAAGLSEITSLTESLPSPSSYMRIPTPTMSPERLLSIPAISSSLRYLLYGSSRVFSMASQAASRSVSSSASHRLSFSMRFSISDSFS